MQRGKKERKTTYNSDRYTAEGINASAIRARLDGNGQ